MTDEIDIKLNEYYAGKVVRKDLTKLIKEGIKVPSYVLEYLLGMYCATDDEDDIESGTAMVKQILADNYVRPDEAEKVKATIKQKGHFKIIDKLSARLNEHTDTFEGEIFNLGISHIKVAEEYIYQYDKLLSAGAKRILIPALDMMQYGSVPADLMTKFSLEVYTDPIDAAFKAIGVK